MLAGVIANSDPSAGIAIIGESAAAAKVVLVGERWAYDLLGAADPDFLRLFMVPGMLHCSGGPGTDTFDAVTALEQWVEHGTVPETLMASHVTKGVATRTRPLCAYPKVAVYSGRGSTDDAANFACRAPN